MRGEKKERLTVRLSPNQLQCLTELKDKLHCSYSLMIRSIIGNFLAVNEAALERIIDKEDIDEYDIEF